MVFDFYFDRETSAALSALPAAMTQSLFFTVRAKDDQQLSQTIEAKWDGSCWCAGDFATVTGMIHCCWIKCADNIKIAEVLGGNNLVVTFAGDPLAIRINLWRPRHPMLPPETTAEPEGDVPC